MSDRSFLSYAQNREDYHLALLFEGEPPGFYVDVGGGHPVADNVSFHFYERGWRGLIVEPQPRLAAAYARVRPRDIVVSALVGRQEGVAAFYEMEEFHGLSTTVAANAAASAERGLASRERRVPVATLAGLCAAHAPARIDFLKIDVEGAEADVIAGNDWTRLRPRIVVVESVTPWSMADASPAFAPMLAAAGYRDVLFDGLNRFYLAGEAAALAGRLPAAPIDWGAMRHLGELGPPRDNPAHPDHALARLLPGDILGRLNDLPDAALAALLPAGVDPASAETRAALARIAAFHDGGYVG